MVKNYIFLTALPNYKFWSQTMTKMKLQVFVLVAILNASSQKSNNGGKEKSPCERNEGETKQTTQLLITGSLGVK